MNLHPPRDPADTKPCAHMRLLVSAFADNKLTGLLRFFTALHLRDCPRCADGLVVIRATAQRLGILETPVPPLSPPRWENVEAAWKQADHASERQ